MNNEKTAEEIGRNLKEYKRRYYQKNKEKIRLRKKKALKNRKVAFKERVPYSSEEIKLINRKLSLKRSYAQIALVCNQIFHSGKNIRNGEALYAYIHRCNRLKKIDRDINNVYFGMEFL